MEDYQAVCRQLEAVECSIPTVGLVEETEERLVERIGLFQVSISTRHKHAHLNCQALSRKLTESKLVIM